jgi:bacterioferritin (cytochrome b1)
MTREEKVQLLNRMLHGAVNSVVQYIEIAVPYVPPYCAERMAELKRMRDEQAKTANELVSLVGELDGVPQVEVFPYWNVDLNYLDVRFLARFAAEHEAKFAAELEEALPDLRDDPHLFGVLDRILGEKRDHLEALRAIAAIPTPAPDPERAKKAVPADCHNVPRPVRAAKPAPRGKA